MCQWSHKCIPNQNCGFMRTNYSQTFDLLFSIYWIIYLGSVCTYVDIGDIEGDVGWGWLEGTKTNKGGESKPIVLSRHTCSVAPNTAYDF